MWAKAFGIQIEQKISGVKRRILSHKIALNQFIYFVKNANNIACWWQQQFEKKEKYEITCKNRRFVHVMKTITSLIKNFKYNIMKKYETRTIP